MLRIWYGNVDGLVRKIDEIREWTEDSEFDILGVGETHVTDSVLDGELKIKGFKMFRSNSHSTHAGGVIVYVKKGIECLGTEIIENKLFG